MRRRESWRGGAAAGAALIALVWISGSRSHAQTSGCGTDLRLLVLSADGTEPSLGAITQTLDYLGTPYTKYIATQKPGGLTSDFLANGCHANFEAVLQTTADLATQTASGYASALSSAEWNALTIYEETFHIRTAAWYAFPTTALGFSAVSPVDTTSSPVTVTLTNAGGAVFPYVAAGAAIPIRYAYTYLAAAVDSSVTPLLTDGAGHTLGAVHGFADGREMLLLTFDQNPDLLHSQILGYGLVSWATRGLFLGERHTFASPQIDDIFVDDSRWLPSTACGTDPETTGVIVRMTGADLGVVRNWQQQRNTRSVTAEMRLSLVFNGEGTTGIYSDDTLTPTARSYQGSFYWINHTYDHELLDAISYGAALDEIRMNNQVASNMAFSLYSPASMVTPEISGLQNPSFLQAAVDSGVRYLVSDTSKPGYGNPFPNVGIYNSIQPSILMIPRRPNDLFYNVAYPSDWVAEYNCLYRSYWGRDFTYDDILNFESGQLLTYLLKGENDPWMFHQSNLVAYDGAHTLLTDLLDRALDRYSSYVTWPIVSPAMDRLGSDMGARMNYLAAHVTATLQDGNLTVVSDRPVVVPITGLRNTDAESYGSTAIAHVSLTANTPVTMTVPPPLGALPSGWDHRDIGAAGLAGTSTYDANSSSFNVTGAGADVWGSADAFQYAYVPVNGDVRITAHVSSVSGVAAWTKAGVMIREQLEPSSPHGFMLVSLGKGTAFQRRTAEAGTSTSTSGGAIATPYWVRIERVGNAINAYQSADGTTWTLVGTDTIPMQANVFAGLAVSSHTTTATASGVFDHIKIDALPNGWTHQDIGAVGPAGATTYDSSTAAFTVTGAGADIWNSADAFQYAWTQASGDVTITARVASVQPVAAWTKAGVMIRATTDPGSQHGFMLVSAGKGIAFQRRTAANGTSTSTSGGAGVAPYWVKLQRVGDTFTASASPDGITWTVVGSDTIPMGSTVLVGLAVSSHTTAAAATAVFDHVVAQ